MVITLNRACLKEGDDVNKRSLFWVVLLCGLYCILIGVGAPAYILQVPGYILHKSQEIRPKHGPFARVGVYVINPNWAKSRRVEIEKLVDQLHLPYQRIAQPDSHVIKFESIKQSVDLQAWQRYEYEDFRISSAVVYLAHMNALKAFLATKQKYALILEDDATFQPKRILAVIDDLKQFNGFWDITMLSAGGYLQYPIGLEVVKLPRSNTRLELLLKGRVWSSAAYFVNRKAARRFLLEYALPIKLNVDLVLRRGWETGLKTAHVLLNPAEGLLYQRLSLCGDPCPFGVVHHGGCMGSIRKKTKDTPKDHQDWRTFLQFTYKTDFMAQFNSVMTYLKIKVL